MSWSDHGRDAANSLKRLIITGDIWDSILTQIRSNIFLSQQMHTETKATELRSELDRGNNACKLLHSFLNLVLFVSQGRADVLPEYPDLRDVAK